MARATRLKAARAAGERIDTLAGRVLGMIGVPGVGARRQGGSSLSNAATPVRVRSAMVSSV